jgi:hypothetical protein
MLLLFEHQDALNSGYLLEYANALQLDVDRFLCETTNPVHTERIAQSIQDGIQSGVRSTTDSQEAVHLVIHLIEVLCFTRF